MKTLLWLAAAYVGYEYVYKPMVSAPAAPAAGAPPAVVTVPAPSAGAPPVANPATTQSMILAKAAADNFTAGTADQWGYYYNQVRNVAAPDPASYLSTDQRFETLTFPEWWAAASSKGLSGCMCGGYQEVG